MGRKEGPGGPRIVVDVTAPADARPVDLLVEGSDPDWAPPLPRLVGITPGGVHRFVIGVDGMSARSSGTALKLAAVADRKAIEVDVPMP